MSYNKQAQARYKKANREKLRQSRRKHYSLNKEQYALTREAYSQKRAELDAVRWQLTKDKPSTRYAKSKGAAKSRDISFLLTLEEFLTFWQKDCSYCGDSIVTIGLDRIDSDGPYSLANVVPCCLTCNKAKSELTQEQFLNHCHKVIKKFGSTRT